MPRREHIERSPARSPREQYRDDAVRRFAERLPDPRYPLGTAAYVTDGARLHWGSVAMVDATSAATVYAPLPVQEDVSRIVTIIRRKGTGAITVALSGATVDGVASFAMAAGVYSAVLMASAAGEWVEI